MCESQEDCVCFNAVTTAYGQLKARRVSEPAAFKSATTVYRYHHPEVPLADARAIVAAWLDGDGGQNAAAPPAGA
jgi:hypothetical protein